LLDWLSFLPNKFDELDVDDLLPKSPPSCCLGAPKGLEEALVFDPKPEPLLLLLFNEKADAPVFDVEVEPNSGFDPSLVLPLVLLFWLDTNENPDVPGFDDPNPVLC